MVKNKNIEIVLRDDVKSFFNVQSFDYSKETDSYILLSQNNTYHIFPLENVSEVIIG